MARYGLFVLKLPLNPNQPTFKVTRSHRKWRRSIRCLWFPINDS